MINYVMGDLLESPAQVLVNTVNTVGVMGKGIAKDFKRIYPDMFRKYQSLCESRLLDVGALWLYKTPHKWILNFPTKRHWRNSSEVEYIEQGLRKFVAFFAEKGITSIAFPQLGCGNGGLDWATQVQPLMEKYLKNLLIDVFVYTYPKGAGVPEHHDVKAISKWLRSEPAQLPFLEVMADLQTLLISSGSFQVLGSDETFEPHIVEGVDEDSLRLKAGGDTWDVEGWQLRMLWNQLRDFGFCAEYTMPCGLAAVSPMIITLLSKLPYLRLVRLSRTYEGLATSSWGLQIAPPISDQKSMPMGVHADAGATVQQSFLE